MPLLFAEICSVPFESITQKPPETEYLPTNTALRTLLLFVAVITIITALTFAACIITFRETNQTRISRKDKQMRGVYGDGLHTDTVFNPAICTV